MATRSYSSHQEKISTVQKGVKVHSPELKPSALKLSVIENDKSPNSSSFFLFQGLVFWYLLSVVSL